MNTLRSIKKSEWAHGRAVGNEDVLFWPVAHTKKKDTFHIVQERDGKVSILGSPKKLPMQMALANDGLYFEYGNAVARYHDGKWEKVLAADDKIIQIVPDDDDLYVLTDEPSIYLRAGSEWQRIELPGAPGMAAMAVDERGSVWVTATQGRIFEVKNGKPHSRTAFDKDKRNYRVVRGPDCLYLHSTTGVYKSGAKPKRVLKDKPQPSGVGPRGDTLVVATRKELVVVKSGRVRARLPVIVEWLGQAGRRTTLSGCPALLIWEADDSWRIIDLPARAKSKPVKLVNRVGKNAAQNTGR